MLSSWGEGVSKEIVRDRGWVGGWLDWLLGLLLSHF